MMTVAPTGRLGAGAGGDRGGMVCKVPLFTTW